MALIDTRTTSSDVGEVARDTLAAIIVAEAASQQALAIAAEADPAPYAMRVYVERFMLDVVGDSDELAPAVNVYLETSDPDYERSIAQGVRAEHVIRCDIYGIGEAYASDGGGHVTADQAASLGAQRAHRLIRQWLLSAQHERLDATAGVLSCRWGGVKYSAVELPGTTQASRPVMLAQSRWRISCEETAPRVQPIPLAGVLLHVTQDPGGQLIMSRQFEFED